MTDIQNENKKIELEIYYNGEYYLLKTPDKRYFYITSEDYVHLKVFLKDQNKISMNKEELNLLKSKTTKRIKMLIESLEKNDKKKKFLNSIILLEFKNADVFFSKIYPLVAILTRTKIFLFVTGILNLIGLVIYSMYFRIVNLNNNFRNMWILIWIVLNIIIHEFAHALSVKHYGREILSAGMKLNFFVPMFFINTTDIIVCKKRERIWASFSAIVANFSLGSITSLATLFVQPLQIKILLINFSTISYVSALINLIPFWKLDGYYILCDVLGIPNLDNYFKKRVKMLIKFKNHRWNNKDIFTLVYWLLSVTFKLVAIGMIIFQLFLFIRKNL